MSNHHQQLNNIEHTQYQKHAHAYTFHKKHYVFIAKPMDLINSFELYKLKP